ncbi:MAG TPA: J domain-containing protein [Ktedonobacteraceae bacterium]
MKPQTTQRVNYYALLRVPTDASFDEIKAAYRTLVKCYHPDTYRFGDYTAQKKAALLMCQINEAYSVLSDSKKRESYDEEFVASLASEASIDTETKFQDSDWLSIIREQFFNQADMLQGRTPFMSVFRKVWLAPIPFCMATSVSLAFWNLGQITDNMFLGAVTAIIAYPLIIVLLLHRLIPPIRHTPLLNIKQKLACLPLIIASMVLAGWIWSVLVDHYGIISSMWNLCWWSALIGITCGLLAYL